AVEELLLALLEFVELDVVGAEPGVEVGELRQQLGLRDGVVRRLLGARLVGCPDLLAFPLGPRLVAARLLARLLLESGVAHGSPICREPTPSTVPAMSADPVTRRNDRRLKRPVGGSSWYSTRSIPLRGRRVDVQDEQVSPHSTPARRLCSHRQGASP